MNGKWDEKLSNWLIWESVSLIQRKPFSLTSKEKMKLKFIFQKIIGDKLNAMEIPLYQNSKHTTMDSGIFLPPILAASIAQKQCFIVDILGEHILLTKNVNTKNVNKKMLTKMLT